MVPYQFAGRALFSLSPPRSILQARAAACTDVSSTDAEVPAGAVLTAAWPAAGVRIWECAAGQLVNASQITGRANYTAAAKPWTGGFYYMNTTAKFVSKNGSDPAFGFRLDSNPGLKPNEGKIADARWTVTYEDDNVPANFKGEVVYLTRTNNTGGATPTKCDNATAATVEVPYTTTYTLYVCGVGKPPAVVVASAAASAAFGMIAAGVIAVAALI